MIFAWVHSLWAAPPKNIPAELYEAFTLENQIPVYEWYIDGSYPAHEPIIFKSDEIDQFIVNAQERRLGYYGPTDHYLYEMLDKYSFSIRGKKIAIIGSVTPWYETIVLVFGGEPTTIEYNKIFCEDPRFTVMTVEEYDRNPQKFDAIISISSIEHDGLGRYGDPIAPQGDLQAMKKMKGMLNEGGLLFLAIPVGEDALYWNAHRVYGPLRLPLLLNEWECIDSSGFSPNDFEINRYHHQPLFVLQPH